MKSREDRLQYMRDWRRTENGRAKHAAFMKKYIRGRVEQYEQFMEGKTCARCGFSDMRALEWHHLDPEKKRFTISYGVRRFSWEKVLEEIENCELLCCNCHRIEHYGKALAHKKREAA